MRHRRALPAVALWTLVALVPASLAAASAAEEAATGAARAWLAQVDAGEYGASWDSAAPLFQGAVEREKWGETLKAVREPLGAVVARTLKSATYTETLPGAPDGEYVVLQFDTSFENKKSAVETVTPTKAADGAWRVSGYFIR